MRKRAISIILTLALLIGIVPMGMITVSGADSGTVITYSVEGGNIYFDKETGTITDCDETVTSAAIPAEIEGIAVTCIGKGAFKDCENLKEITIPEGVEEIRYEAFKGCSALTNIALPSTLTHIQKGTYTPFWWCWSLTEITVDSENPNYSSQDGVLFSKDMTTLIRYPEGKSDNTYIIPETVDYIYEAAFLTCKLLKNVVIPEGVDKIQSDTFYGCALDSFIFLNPMIRISTGSSIWWDSSALGSNTAKLHGYEVELYDAGTGKSVKDFAESLGFVFEAHTFENGICTICGTESFSKEGECGENAQWRLEYPSGLLRIDGTGEIAVIGWDGYGALVTNVEIGEGITSISEKIFSYAEIEQLTLPESLTSIGDSAFYDCAIDSVYINSLESWCNIEFEFTTSNPLYDGASLYVDGVLLTEIDKISNIAEIQNYAFYGYDSLQSVTIPDSVTSIGDSAFCFCSGLSEVNIPNSVESVGSSAFYGTAYYNEASNWQDGVLYINQWLLKADYSVLTGDYAILPNTVGIGDSAFLGCSSLTSVTIPDGVTSISDSAFSNCTSLTDVTIPDSVTSISEWAFNHCGSLTNVNIPDSVVSIGDNAFYCCDSLTGVYFQGTAPLLGDKVFYTRNEEGEYCLIEGLTLYYIEGKEGWTSPTWNGYPTATWAPHEHSYTAVVTAPTCTEQGYTTYTCECGDSYVADYVDALGHEYADGVCTRCGEEDPDYVPEDPTKPVVPVEFSDVSDNAWYAEEVDYAVENGLMNGTGNNKFEPESAMTRAMLVTVLWRYAVEPLEGENVFTDVKDGQWYTEAVAWAAENGIVGGVGDGKFDPDGKITREQLAAILYRYCNSVGIDVSAKAELSSFPDGGKVSDYAQDPLAWAVAVGLVTGTKEGSNTYLDPQGSATRAQVATILMRFIENIAE